MRKLALFVLIPVLFSQTVFAAPGPLGSKNNIALKVYNPMFLVTPSGNGKSYCSIAVSQDYKGFWWVHSAREDSWLALDRVNLGLHKAQNKVNQSCNFQPKDGSYLLPSVVVIYQIENIEYDKNVIPGWLNHLVKKEQLKLEDIRDIFTQRPEKTWSAQKLFKESHEFKPQSSGVYTHDLSQHKDTMVGNAPQPPVTESTSKQSDVQKCVYQPLSCLDVKNYVPNVPNIPGIQKLMGVAFLFFLLLSVFFVFSLIQSAIDYIRGKAIGTDELAFKLKMFILLLMLVSGIGFAGGFNVVEQILDGIAKSLPRP